MINKITRPQENNTGTCIDHIFLKTNENINCCKPVILENDITDHFTTINTLSLLNSLGKNSPKKKYLTRINYKLIEEKIASMNYEGIANEKDPDEAIKIITESIQDTVRACTYIARYNDKKIMKKEWVTIGLLKSIEKKREMYAELKKNSNDGNLKKEYNSYRNKLNTLTKMAKITYYTNLINKNGSDTKNMWTTVRQITQTAMKEHREIDEIENQDGNVVTGNKNIANAFNQYFIRAGVELASKIKDRDNVNFKKKQLKQTIFLWPTDINEIDEIISKLKTNKAPGFDGMTTEIIKKLRHIISQPLSVIINKILVTGVCPNSFKKTIVTVLHKAGEKSKIGNYRPISLVTVLTKIFENIVKERVSSFLKKHKILSDSQFGFREGKCTEDAITLLVTEIQNAINTDHKCLGIFVDFAKAFDTVNHKILLTALEDIGIRGTANRLLKSYLEDRIQITKINKELSDEEKIKCGVPQGTILGPILFLIYINNLYEINGKGKIISFADDTVIFYKGESWTQLKETAETDFSDMAKWFDSHLLTINYEKTKFVPFSPTKYTQPLFDLLEINSDTKEIKIQRTKEIKYLGIHVDCYLKWDIHAINLVKKVRKLIYKFKILSQMLTEKHLMQVYHALVKSVLEYGILAWGGIGKSHYDSVEKIQKWILKIIFKKPRRYPSELLYEETKILDVRQLYLKKVLTYQHKNAESLCIPQHKHNTRSKDTQISETRRANKKYSMKALTYIGPRLYNLLPLEIRSIKKINHFQKKTTQWITNTNRGYIHKIIENCHTLNV